MTLQNALQKTGELSAKHPYKILFLTLILLVIAGFGASQIQMEMGMDLYIDEDSQTMQAWNEIREDFNKGNVMFVMLQTNQTDLYEPENAQYIANIYEQYYEELKHGDIDAVSLVTSFSHPIKAGPGGGQIPQTKEEIVHSMNFSFNQHRSNMAIIANLHPDIQQTQEYQQVTQALQNEEFPVAGDGTQIFTNASTALFMIQYGNLDIEQETRLAGLLPISQHEVMLDKVKNITESQALPAGATITYTGTPVFENAAFGLMLPEMIQLFTIAFAIIFLTVFLLMRTRLDLKRNITLPIITSLIAVIIMVGMMGFLNYNFNAIMLGVLPIALGLSIDYSLQIHSRFLEEKDNGLNNIRAAGQSTRHVGRALLIAMTTTAIGLGALLISQVPPVRQFALTAIIAIVGSMVLSITLLPALLSLASKKTHKTPTYTMEDKTRTYLSLLEGKFSYVLLIGIVLIVLGAIAAPSVQTTNDMLDYWPNIQEKDDIDMLKNSLPAPNILYLIAETEDAYTYENFEEIQRFQQNLEQQEHILTVMSAPRAMVIHNSRPPVESMTEDALPSREDFAAGLQRAADTDSPPQLGLQPEDHPNRVIVQLFVEDIEGDTERQVIDSINRVAQQELPNQETRLTGELVLNRNVIENVTSGLLPMTVLSFVLGLVFLSFAIRSIKDATIIIASVAVSTVLMLTGAMYVFGIPWNPLTVTISAIILGIGIDYGVHVFERYKEELGKGASVKNAIFEGLAKKSRPILASGITTLLGFGVLAISDFPVLSNFGYAIVLSMAIVLLTTFTLLPATILAIDGLKKKKKRIKA